MIAGPIIVKQCHYYHVEQCGNNDSYYIFSEREFHGIYFKFYCLTGCAVSKSRATNVCINLFDKMTLISVGILQ